MLKMIIRGDGHSLPWMLTGYDNCECDLQEVCVCVHMFLIKDVVLISAGLYYVVSLIYNGTLYW